MSLIVAFSAPPAAVLLAAGVRRYSRWRLERRFAAVLDALAREPGSR